MIALAPNGSRLYVAQANNSSIAILNTRPGRLLTIIHLPHQPNSLAVSPDGSHIYVGQWAGQFDGQLSVINAMTGAATTVQVGGPVPGLAISADGATLYLAMCRAGLRKMNTRTGAIQIIYRQFCPWGIALAPDQKSLWVNFQGGGPGGGWGHDAVAKFDVISGKLSGTVTGMANVGGAIIASRDGKTVWVDGLDACVASAYDHAGCPAVPAGVVHVIDATTMKVVCTLPKAEYGTIALSTDQRVAVLAGTHLVLIDTSDFHSIAAIAGRFFDVAFSPNGNYVYATSTEKPEIVIMKVRRF